MWLSLQEVPCLTNLKNSSFVVLVVRPLFKYILKKKTNIRSSIKTNAKDNLVTLRLS